MAWGWGYRPYVSVAERRKTANSKKDKLRKQGINVQAVEIEGRKIAQTFWGQSWCQHLESFSDYANRLPRGRTYVRNGSVCHLEISSGKIKAIVSGTELYDVKIEIPQLARQKWSAVKELCAGKIGSLLELLQGRLSSSVMTVVTDRHKGLFPLPSEIKLDCSCPDWATMCKHVAAVLYGVGARLDTKPELIFLLRGVDLEELIQADAAAATAVIGSAREGRHLADSDLEAVFGIEMLAEESPNNGQQKIKPSKANSQTPRPFRSSSKTQNAVGASRQTVNKKIAKETPTDKAKMSSRKTVDAKAKAAAISTVNKPLPVTGKTIRDLLARLDMSASQLALVIGVSAKSVKTWEKKKGQLNLQPQSSSALTAALKLTKKQAWARLSASDVAVTT